MTSSLDRYARIGLTVGIGLILQPYWGQGLRVGFFVTLVSTILHIVASHLPVPAHETD